MYVDVIPLNDDKVDGMMDMFEADIELIKTVTSH